MLCWLWCSMWLYCTLWTIKCLDYIMMSIYNWGCSWNRGNSCDFFPWIINHSTLLKRHKCSTHIKSKFIRTCIVQSYHTDALQMNLGFSSNNERIKAFQTMKIDFSVIRTATIYHFTDIVLACKEAQLHSISTIHLMTVWSKSWGEEAHGSLTWHIERPPFLLSTYK